MDNTREDIPSWLKTPEHYRPGTDRDGFVSRSLLSLSAALAQFRLDGGRQSRCSPTAATKLLFAVGCVLLVSLSRNYLFVLIMLAGVLVRACLLPREALAHVMAGATTAAGFTLLVMLPAILLGQAQSPVTLATKAFVSTGLVLSVALTTPTHKLTRALRRFGMPGVAILTADLALRSIVSLGQTASDILAALQLRSVGRNHNKQASMGGVGGVTLLKASRAAQDTYDAMRCRGFDGSYELGSADPLTWIDACWGLLFAALVAAFFYLQGLV